MYKKLFSYFDRYFFFFKKNVFFLCCFSIVIAILELASIGMIIPILDIFFSDNQNYKLTILREILKDYYNLEFFILSIIFFFITKYFIQIIYYQKLNKFLFDSRQKLVEKILKKLLMQNFIFFSGKKKTDFLHTCVDDVNNYTVNFLKPAIIFFSELVIVTFIFFFLLFINITIISFLILYFFLIFIIYIKLIKKPLNHYGSIRRKTEKIRLLNLTEIFNAIKEIKIYKYETVLLDRFKKNNKENVYANYKNNLFADFAKIYFEFFLLILFFISLLIAKNFNFVVLPNFSILGAIAYGGLKILPSLNKLSSSYQMISFGKSTVSSIQKILQIVDPNTVSKVLSDSFEEIKLIEFKNVKFQYDQNNCIFKNLNIVLSSREKIGILGPSGSGKSSFIEMIMKINRPQEGSVEINNRNIDDFNYSTNSIGYAPQDFIFFNDTIENNILIGRPKRNDHNEFLSTLFSSLNLSHLKLNQLIYDNEENLSGGEKQRIGLARVLYEEPKFLLMDETTNSIDSETEKKIFEALQRFKNLGYSGISHNKKLLESFCEKLYSVENKKLVLINNK